MRVLFDHNMPRYLLKVGGHLEIVPAAERGWEELKNGNLLDQAELAGFPLLMTIDKGVEHQINMDGRAISVVLLKSKSSNSRKGLLPLFQRAVDLLPDVEPGKLYVVEG